jgi:molybdopterin/thiamine biosynthesis adenylyltransferase
MLLKKLSPTPQPSGVPQPIFFDLSSATGQSSLASLLEKQPQLKIIDTYEDQLKEFFVLQNPQLHQDHQRRDQEFQQFLEKNYGGRDQLKTSGQWVHLPWRNTLLHLLDDEKFQVVRTGRNRNLITPEEQKKFYNSVIGIAGQSVGNSCTLSIVLTGGGKHLRLADPDRLELTNLNRIRGSIAEITNYKVYMTAHQIYELDPYTKLELFTDGLTEENIEKFFDGPPRLDIVVDEIDHLGMKIRIRQEAKKRKIPVIMAADNGDSGVLDIERHDLDNNIYFFHGRAGKDVAEQVINKKLSLPEIARIIGDKIIGFDIHEERLIESLLVIGKEIPTWPQLGTAATLNGVLVSVAIRKILNHQPIVSSRAIVSLPSLLEPDYHDKQKTLERQSRLLKLGNEFLSLLNRVKGKS